MPRRKKNDVEFLEWVNRLDDPYKVFLFSLISAIFFFVFLTTGIQIDPDSLRELALGEIINSLGNDLVSSIWDNFVGPVLTIIGLIQVGISIYAIYKYGKTGIIISGCGFFGILGLLFTTKGLPNETIALWLPMITASWFFARKNSKLKFDRDGKVIMD